MQNVKLYDTTLRDGAQTEGISFSVADKLKVVEKLDELGIHYIEGGWPGSNPKEMEFFKKVKKLKLAASTIVSFGATCRFGAAAAKDKNIQALLEAETEVVTIFGKTWDLHVRDVLKISLDENLKLIDDSIRYLRSKGKTLFFDAEHYFDAYLSNPQYTLKVLQAALDAGAGVLCMCDTNGGMVTSQLFEIVEETRSKIKADLGIHTHNDSEMAVANSIAAVQAGCVQVQGTINGYGERCGNANLISIIPNLKLKLGLDCISPLKLTGLTEASRYIAEICNMRQQDNQPFTGVSAFAHKGGVHVDAIMKNPKTYEHIEPETVGNQRRLLISELSGKSAVLIKAKAAELNLQKDSDETKKILNLLQDLEHRGYHFEAAEGSFELLMKRAMKKAGKYFDFLGFRITVEKDEKGRMTSEATIKLKVRDKKKISTAEGDGPVNALDRALRGALKDFYPTLSQMHLSDFKVRVLDEKAGTAARVRVLIESQDAKDAWWTIGVSENIIEASWQALSDSVEYKLMKDKV